MLSSLMSRCTIECACRCCTAAALCPMALAASASEMPLTAMRCAGDEAKGAESGPWVTCYLPEGSAGQTVGWGGGTHGSMLSAEANPPSSGAPEHGVERASARQARLRCTCSMQVLVFGAGVRIFRDR